MRGLMVAVVVMGVLIVGGTTGLVVLAVHRMSQRSPGPNADIVLNEPSGTHIAGIIAVKDRVALLLQGGGADRVLLVDPASGRTVGQIRVAH